MADDLKEFVHERFRRTDEKLDRVIELLGDLRMRIGILEQQGASLSNRIDRMESRLERIERRLDLSDPVVSG
ncbi:MAG: hypothetical protein F9K29_07900 [Hyphomicrobiaceae bacterium]|nr:MAG: hypothetical protein F9K29_07900 [Hyphomicrobiaceae bacterium]